MFIMKKFVRVLAGVLAVVAIAGLLSGCKPAEPKNRLEAIKAKGTLEVATEPYFAPNEFIDPTKPKDEQVVGADIELAKYIAEKLGVKAKIVPLEFSAVLAGVAEGKYDMAISALAYKPDRAQAMNLSKGYFFNKLSKGHGLLIRIEDKDKITGPDSLAGLTVAAQSGSLQEMFVNDQIKGFKEFKRVSATTDGFLMVQEKKADACATMFNTAELFIEANKDCGMMMIPDFRFAQDESTDGTRIAMTKGEDELTAKVNEIIDEVLQNGVYEKWYQEYTDYAQKLGVK